MVPPSQFESSFGESAHREPLHIDCDRCAHQHTDTCADCLVTFLCGREADVPVVVDLAEARALRLLGDAGLAPPLRHRATPPGGTSTIAG